MMDLFIFPVHKLRAIACICCCDCGVNMVVVAVLLFSLSYHHYSTHINIYIYVCIYICIYIYSHVIVHIIYICILICNITWLLLALLLTLYNLLLLDYLMSLTSPNEYRTHGITLLCPTSAVVELKFEKTKKQLLETTTITALNRFKMDYNSCN